MQMRCERETAGSQQYQESNKQSGLHQTKKNNNNYNVTVSRSYKGFFAPPQFITCAVLALNVDFCQSAVKNVLARSISLQGLFLCAYQALIVKFDYWLHDFIYHDKLTLQELCIRCYKGSNVKEMSQFLGQENSSL